MATLDFWIEGELGEPHINWHADVPFDLNRYHYDDKYAHVVNKHVERALEYLATELSEISLMTPPANYNQTNCE